MEVTLTQHPVGQGGMMSGWLEVPDGRFHWVYDCGSNQADALKREIAVVAARGSVDCLFISHLDSDHVNGIDLLLAQTSVSEVVLPYLSDLDRLVAAAHDATAGALSRGFVTFLVDIPEWFSARGVERVTFIGPRSDDDGLDLPAPEFPVSDGGGGEGPIRAKWLGGRLGDAGSFRAAGRADGGAQTQYLTTDASLALFSTGGMIDWLLMPYAHRPSDKRLLVFRQAMSQNFGRRYSAQLINLIADNNVREEIKGYYDIISSDHNRVSMAHYAGPLKSWDWKGHCATPAHDMFFGRYSKAAVAWLGTGDMPLNVGVRRKNLFERYQHVLDRVNVFGLPHHGSHRNFHPSLIPGMPNLRQCVAAAGPNGYGHPHTAVVHNVYAAGRQFIQVSDQGMSILRWRHSR